MTKERTGEVVLHRRAAASVREADGAVDHAPREEAQPSGAVRRAWVRVSKIGKFCRIFAKFANFWRARSRLYQNEILQENMRLTAFFKLYKICILLHRCNLKIFAKNRFEKTQFS